MNKKELLEENMENKLKHTKRLIIEWYEHFEGNVYVAFSGGKDSTVLLHIVRSLYPDVEAVFANTGLEYPEIIKFVKKFDNVTVIKPKEQSQYISQYRNAKSQKTKDTRWYGNKWGQGKISEKWKYLVKSDFKITDKCCEIFKKNPFKKYEKESGKFGFIGTLAGESSHRKTLYLKDNCNGFKKKRPMSKPISFWSDADIYKYIRDFNVEISYIYEIGYERTGCIFCMYGLHLEKNGDNRFDRMKKTHPKLYDYCMNNLGLKKVIDVYLKNE